MSSNFRKTTSNLFLSAFIGVILVSFMFTGSEYMMSSPDEVADVGGTVVKFAEYENEYKRQTEFFKQFFGGKDLTQAQIQQYDLKNKAVNNIVARKLMGNIAKEIGSNPSTEEVKKDIKSQPYFKTNEQFDINRYKVLLSRSGLSPEAFEKETVDRLQLQAAQNIFNSLPISNSYMKEVESLRSQKKTLQIISYKKDTLKKHIPVSKSEIDTYLKDKDNLAKIKDLFSTRKASLSKPEQVLASHILLKTDGKNDSVIKAKIEKLAKTLTSANFAKMANKHSEDGNLDPKTKNKKGGDLGWFGKGRMVPEFEEEAFKTAKNGITKPIKTQFGYHLIHIRDKKAKVEANFDDHKNSITKGEILFSKLKEIDTLSDELVKKVTEALKQNNKKNLKGLEAKFSLTHTEDKEVNILDGIGEENKIEDAEFQKLFTSKIGSVHTFKTSTDVKIIKVEAHKKVVALNKEGKVEAELTIPEKKEELAKVLSRKLSQNMINAKKESTKVKIYSKRL